MRYVKGKIKKTSDNEWIFVYKVKSTTADRELRRVKYASLTPTDLEVVQYHAEDLKASHKIEYRGEEIKAEIIEMWSNPDGKYSKIRPAESYLPFSEKKMFAKLIYKEEKDESED